VNLLSHPFYLFIPPSLLSPSFLPLLHVISSFLYFFASFLSSLLHSHSFYLSLLLSPYPSKCWTFLDHEWNWLLFECRCFNCPFVNRNDQISQLGQCLSFPSSQSFVRCLIDLQEFCADLVESFFTIYNKNVYTLQTGQFVCPVTQDVLNRL
jgi:hypothetical protein